jgi:hypothetical protein
MNINPRILAELQQLAPTLAQMPRVPVFEVPAGYFEQLSSGILFKINELEQENGSLPAPKNQGFEAPAGYFEGLADSILGRIKAEESEAANISAASELAQLSPTLAAIGKKMPFETPRSYFDQLAERMTTAATAETGAKVVSMGGSQKRNWFKYATAACVIGLLGFFAVRMFTPGKTKMNVDTEIAGTGMTYKQIMTVNVDTELEKVTTNQAENFLCDNGVIACNESKEDNLQDALQDIKQEDVDDFLGAQN